MIGVLGGQSQLASAMRWAISDKRFIYFNSSEVNILDKNSIRSFIRDIKPELIINCSAYTNVNLAEEESKNCIMLNLNGVENLVNECEQQNIHIVHISTDYVFDGRKSSPYTEFDEPNPLNIYGSSKRDAEKFLINNYINFSIIRTSWLYSGFKKNFLKTIFLRALMKEPLNVQSRERGTPTDAIELAFAIERLSNNLKFAKSKTFHFSGNHSVSWKQFANDIISVAFELGFLKDKLEINDYVYDNASASVAIRPINSALDSSKFVSTFGFKHASYKNCIKRSLEIIAKERKLS